MKIDIDIETILNGTPTVMVGEDICNYASECVAGFERDGEEYTINAVFDLENEIKTLVIANDEDIIINCFPEKQQVFLVKQTQPSEDYHDYTIAVFTDERKALELARGLNQEYGKGCVFDDNWDFVELDTCEDLHYYTIEGLNLNPDSKNFF